LHFRPCLFPSATVDAEHAPQHEPILDRDLFEAVQTKLGANAVARKVRLRGSASILAGRILMTAATA
jgi:hypothetical protein